MCVLELQHKSACFIVLDAVAHFLLEEVSASLQSFPGQIPAAQHHFVMPARLVEASEIPAECGLIEAGSATPSEWKELFSRQSGFFSYDADARTCCMITIPAPWRETPGPTWQLVAAMMRNQRRAWEGRPSSPSPQQRFSFEV